MTALKNIFVLLSAIFASIPGLSIIIANLGVPPGESKILYGGVIEALCCLCLLCLWVNRGKIRKIPMHKINRLSVVGGCVFFVSLIIYIFIYKSCVISHQKASVPVFFPLWANGELDTYITRFNGSNSEVLGHLLADETEDMIARSSSTALNITSIIFLFIYQLIFTSLVFAFGMLGVRTSR